MHIWGDENVDWKGIEDAAEFIHAELIRRARINVSQSKEKYGTVRVYCYLGWSSFHSLCYPGYCSSQWLKWYTRWLWYLDCVVGYRFFNLFQNRIIKWHSRVYRQVYVEAVAKWPHLRDEILVMADFQELVDGIAGYNTKEHWR